MSKKGLVFSMTAVYCAGLIMLFLSLIFLSVNYYNTTTGQEKGYYRNIVGVFDTETTSSGMSYYWCSVYMSYDANASNLSNQSSLTIKEYCEEYGK